jgi:acyl-CoA dehydrogenase
VLNGTKAWITNAGVADQYIVVARTGEAPGAKGLSVFIVDADSRGLTVGPPDDMVAPHPIAGLRFEDCFVPARQMIGAPGEGFKAAMSTFDIFRTSVGAAAIGMARRALDETLERVTTRRMFGKTMAELESVQARLADMALDTESGALLVYRAAWARDVRGGRVSRDVALAKLGATEAAQRVIDSAVQLFGGQGVARGCIVEQLYRDIRPLRIYEGASEVQKLIVARSLLAQVPNSASPTDLGAKETR